MENAGVIFAIGVTGFSVVVSLAVVADQLQRIAESLEADARHRVRESMKQKDNNAKS